jgi:pantoate--beta-alanine ligase
VSDLAFDVEVVGCVTQRAVDGLALSSRNARLSAQGLTAATSLSRALHAARDSHVVASGRRTLMRDVMRSAGVDVAYADVVDVLTLQPLSDEDRGVGRALVAGVVEGVRLIDNEEIDLSVSGG